jgi:hypothetical protein
MLKKASINILQEFDNRRVITSKHSLRFPEKPAARDHQATRKSALTMFSTAS